MIGMNRIRGIIHGIRARFGSLIRAMIGDAFDSARRFPFAIAACLAAAAVYAVGIFTERTVYWEQSIPVILACVLSGPIFVAFRLFCGEKQIHRKAYIAGNLIIVLLAAGYAVYLENYYARRETIETIRFTMLAFAAVLTIPCAPFLRGRRDIAAHYAVDLGIRFSISAVFAVVLFGGIWAAFKVIHSLLEISVSWKLYLVMIVFIFGVFMPTHFLSGVPEKKNDSAKLFYPRPLMILIGNIMLPLLTVYLVITYIYFGKAIVTLSWPEGTVANMILVFSVTGFFLLFIVSPIERKGKQWVSRYAKYFSRALLPLIVLLFIAIGRRVYDYGITERRYFIIALALWLTGITVYWLVSKKRSYFVIPCSLLICSVLSVFGPWGAFNISRNSQLHRLEYLLATDGIAFLNGVRTQGKPTGKVDHKEVESIVRYLCRVHGTESISFIPVSVRDKGADVIITKGIGYENKSVTQRETRVFHADWIDSPVLPVDGYRFVTQYRSGGGERTLKAGRATVRFSKNTLTAIMGNKTEKIDLLSAVADLPVVNMKTIGDKYHVDDMVYRKKLAGVRVMIIFTFINLEYDTRKPVSVGECEYLLLISPDDRTTGIPLGR
jgi:hypothetical protein